jgi:hypothetical protein
MGEADYYLLNGDQEQGPWTLGELQAFWQAGAVTLETLHARPGMSEWKPLSTIFGAVPPTTAQSGVAEKNVKQLGLQVGFGKTIQNAIETVANQVASGVFDNMPGEDKATMGWEWYALHDRHQNCDKCGFYDGQRWTRDYKPVGGGPEFPGKPPLHASCQCTLIPVDLDGGPPVPTQLDDVFRSQDKLSLETSFGKANTEAFLGGRLNGRQLLQQSTFKVSPDDLKRLKNIWATTE